jgi:hypothetical protein
LWKATISFIMSVYQSICMEQLCSHWTDFDETCYLSFFRKCAQKIEVSSKSDKKISTLHEVFTFVTVSCWIRHKMRNISDESCRENQNTHFRLVTFIQKSYHVWDNVEKYGGASGATDDNMAAHCMLD